MYMYFRVFKQTLRSAGDNQTKKHVENVSMSVPVLLEAARKADQTFGVPPPTTAHTVRGASQGITKMTDHLLENTATAEVEHRTEKAFIDLTESGWKKMLTTWLKDTLERTAITTDENLGTAREQEEPEVV